MEETAARVIQSCYRTLGGRIKRHYAFRRTLAAGLEQRGWRVEQEAAIRTSEGLRKPDIIARKEDVATIVDAQVVSGALPLDHLHNVKREKYNRPAVLDTVAVHIGLPANNIGVTTCTLSWRGIWSSRSAEQLKDLGLSERFLAGITTRALQGSHTNWTRFTR